MDEYFKYFTTLEDLDAPVFQETFPTLHLQQQAISHQDLLISDHSLAPTPTPAPAPAPAPFSGVAAFSRQPRESLAAPNAVKCGKRTKDDKKMKKIANREIERQRRHEMANLYSSLRNLLPLEYIKGKRSVSDHVSGAVTYIKCMEENIKELQGRRNKLLKVSHKKDLGLPGEKLKNGLLPEIKIKPCSHGVMEIIVRNTTEDEAVPLPRLLKLLLEEGLSVTSCVSSKLNGKFLYTILTEESLMNGGNMCALLQQRLYQKLTF